MLLGLAALSIEHAIPSVICIGVPGSGRDEVAHIEGDEHRAAASVPPAPADDVHLLAGEADVVDARQMFFFRTSAMTSAYLTPPIELIR